MVMLQDVPAGTFLPAIQFTTAAQGQSATAGAGQVSPAGAAGLVVMNCTTGTPGTYTTRTATQMIADGGLFLGSLWLLLLVNGQASGTLTFTAGSGVTLTGTATVAASTARLFQAQVMNVATPAITFTNLYSFTATALAFGA